MARKLSDLLLRAGCASATGSKFERRCIGVANKKKHNRKGLKFLCMLLGICLAGVVVSGVWLGIDLYRDWQGRQFYNNFAAYIRVYTAAPGDKDQPRTLSFDNEIIGDSGGDAPAKVDKAKSAWVPHVNFEGLREHFPGIVGWIELEDTAINYPIMQWSDNYFFLEHLPDGARHRKGSIFLDYRSSPHFEDKNTLIYGHESRTDDMFGVLKHFRSQDFYDENSRMHVYTPVKDYQLAIFAGYLVDSADEQPRINFNGDEDFAEYIDDIRKRSFFKSDAEVSLDDKIVSLCTCAYDFPNARLIIVGKLVEI